MDVGDKLRQERHVMTVLAIALPVVPTGQPLAQQLPQAGTRQRSYMRICQVGKTEHDGSTLVNRDGEFDQLNASVKRSR
jgi:hypothetical protein